MRKIVFVVLTMVFTFALSNYARADQAVYAPGPVDGMDVWLSSYYDYGDDYGVDDWKLQAGGWGDEYRFLIQFDLTDLPSNPTSVDMWMVAYDRGDSSVPVDMYVDIVTEAWDEDTGWNDQPGSYSIWWVPAPTPGYWYGLNITNVYNDWKNGTYPNYGFKFKPISTNNEFSQFFSSDLPSEYYHLRPRIVVNYDGANFAFPLAGVTPYTAKISAIVDHYMTNGLYCKDDMVAAYTGEIGAKISGESVWSVLSPSTKCLNGQEQLHGFKNSSGTKFKVNGNYDSCDTGNVDCELFLFYDGHDGYDFPAVPGTDVYAVADGIAYLYNDYGANGVRIEHSGGYETISSHLSSQSITDGQNVTKGVTIIGKTGTKDMHFTVKKNGKIVDPYGWLGEWGADPLQIDEKDNVCLWENCQWLW